MCVCVCALLSLYIINPSFPLLLLWTSKPQRYSSFEAHVVDGEVLDGETGWTSPSRTNQPHSRRASATGGNVLGHSSNSPGAGGLTNKPPNGTGSGLRPGGRSNFFFGADYSTLAGTSHLNARAESVAAKLPAGPVDRKAAALLGVAGSAAEVPSKAQKVLGVGRREGEEGRLGVLALQDEVCLLYVVLHIAQQLLIFYLIFCVCTITIILQLLYRIELQYQPFCDVNLVMCFICIWKRAVPSCS